MPLHQSFLVKASCISNCHISYTHFVSTILCHNCRRFFLNFPDFTISTGFIPDLHPILTRCLIGTFIHLIDFSLTHSLTRDSGELHIWRWVWVAHGSSTLNTNCGSSARVRNLLVLSLSMLWTGCARLHGWLERSGHTHISLASTDGVPCS